MQIPIVNKDDEIIGRKNRADIDYANDIVRSSSLWITNNEGNILLAKRKMTKETNPGKWAEAVGGLVEGNESYSETIYREAKEELGIRNLVFSVGPKQFVIGPQANYFVQWYDIVLDWPIEKFKIQDTEVEEIAWFDKNELWRKMQKSPEKYIDVLPKMFKLLS